MTEKDTLLRSFHPPQYFPSSDNMDCLPDPILLLIFNKLLDIKTLGRCCAVSKRFKAIALQVENVVVKVDCIIWGEDDSLNVTGKGLLSHLVRIVSGSLAKPLQAVQQWMGSKQTVLAEVSHHSPAEVLRNFRDIQNLRIELPGGELGVEEGVLLKWRAEFGSTLQNCVILGADSVLKNENCMDGVEDKSSWMAALGEEAQENSGSIPESLFVNGGLKLRVVWTISSVIAASARHYLLHQVICDHPVLQNLVLTDADGQGMLFMNREQLQEFRAKPLATSTSSSRTQVPALSLKLWYDPCLELPNETCITGATLVALRPCDQPAPDEAETYASSAFERPFKSAVSTLLQRRMYLLEMNSF